MRNCPYSHQRPVKPHPPQREGYALPVAVAQLRNSSVKLSRLAATAARAAALEPEARLLLSSLSEPATEPHQAREKYAPSKVQVVGTDCAHLRMRACGLRATLACIGHQRPQHQHPPCTKLADHDRPPESSSYALPLPSDLLPCC